MIQKLHNSKYSFRKLSSTNEVLSLQWKNSLHSHTPFSGIDCKSMNFFIASQSIYGAIIICSQCILQFSKVIQAQKYSQIVLEQPNMPLIPLDWNLVSFAFVGPTSETHTCIQPSLPRRRHWVDCRCTPAWPIIPIPWSDQITMCVCANKLLKNKTNVKKSTAWSVHGFTKGGTDQTSMCVWFDREGRLIDIAERYGRMTEPILGEW